MDDAERKWGRPGVVLVVLVIMLIGLGFRV